MKNKFIPGKTYRPFEQHPNVPSLLFHDYPAYQDALKDTNVCFPARALVNVFSPNSIVYINYRQDDDFLKYLRDENILPSETVVLNRSDLTFDEADKSNNTIELEKAHIYPSIKNTSKFLHLKTIARQKNIQFLDSYSYDNSSKELSKSMDLESYGYKSDLQDSKSDFRMVAKKAGLPIASGVENITAKEVVKYATNSAVSVIIKPTFGSEGAKQLVFSSNTQKNALTEYLKIQKMNSLFIVEEFLPIRMVNSNKLSYCARAFINKDGLIYLESLGDQIFGQDGLSYIGHSFPSSYDNDQLKAAYDSLISLGNFLYKNFGYYGHFSIDTGVDDRTGKLVIFEYNLRKGGGTYGKSIVDKRVTQVKNFDKIYQSGIFYWDSTITVKPEKFKKTLNNFKKSGLLFDPKTGQGITMYFVDLLPTFGKLKINIIGSSLNSINKLREKVKKYE